MSDKPFKVVAGTPDTPLVIGNVRIPCYVLEDGTRVLVQRGMASGLDMSNPSGAQIGRFVASKTLKPFIPDDLRVVLNNPIRFSGPGGNSLGYPATLLVDLCKAVLEARDAGALQKPQAHIAVRAELLVRGFATVGIIALVDEATGYQEIRDRNELNKILDRYLMAEHAKWSKRFPDDFYREIFRLRGWEWRGMNVNRPQVVAAYTNDFVWDRLAPGVRQELERLNPVTESGARRTKHHQWLTPDIGNPALQKHLEGVMAIMRGSIKWDAFKRTLQRAYPKIHVTTDMFDD